MKILLDTHLLLWAAALPKKLSKAARALINDEGNELYFSAASFWEISIKQALGRSDFSVEPRRLAKALTDNGYAELVVSTEHTFELASLPGLHKDPFDRLLFAQARTAGMTLLSVDRGLAAYGSPVRLV